MKNEINQPKRSKINWSAFVIAIVNIIALAGYIPQDYLPHIVVIVNIGLPVLIMYFRTYKTNNLTKE